MILWGFCDILRFRLITFTLTLITPDNTKTESNSCFIIHRFKENNEKRIMFKVLLWSKSRYPFFYVFVHNRSFLVTLPNFNLLRTLRRAIFGPLFPAENLAPPLIFLVPIFGWKLEYMTSFSQKYRTDWNYNKNKCGKLHEYRGQSFCSSSCEFLY